MLQRFFLSIVLLLAVMAQGACAGGKHPSVPDGPGFWIDGLDEPDSVVLTVQEIAELNGLITAKVDQMADMDAFPSEVDGLMLSEWLRFEPLPGATEPRFSAGGEPLGGEFFSSIGDNMAIERVSALNPVSFGVVVERADVRAFPSSQVVIKRPGGFDTLQYSSIAPGERVALLHTSADGRWGFFQTRFVRGWMRLDHVAFGLGGPDAGAPFIVVTGSAETVYSDMRLEKPAMSLPMGSRLYLAGGSGADESPYYAVLYPASSPAGLVWRTGYVDKAADVSEGFLPYTRRNIITQAFKMLGEEYGWGGQGGRRDCSAFIMDVFASVGVSLPRNSAQQGRAGLVRLAPGGGAEAVAAALDSADAGTTLLTLDGHIMLYIGAVDGRPHVIHQIWGYMSGAGLNELKKVSVTGLELGAGSGSGAFKERIRSVTEVTLSPAFIGKEASGAL